MPHFRGWFCTRHQIKCSLEMYLKYEAKRATAADKAAGTSLVQESRLDSGCHLLGHPHVRRQRQRLATCTTGNPPKEPSKNPLNPKAPSTDSPPPYPCLPSSAEAPDQHLGREVPLPFRFPPVWPSSCPAVSNSLEGSRCGCCSLKNEVSKVSASEPPLD